MPICSAGTCRATCPGACRGQISQKLPDPLTSTRPCPAAICSCSCSSTLAALLCYQRVQKNPYGRVLADAMTTIENRYLEPIEASELFEGAMDGMVGQLDDYSAYISPADLQEFHEDDRPGVRRRGNGGDARSADQAVDGAQPAGRLAGVQGGHPRRRQNPADRRGQHPGNVAERRRRPVARQARRARHAHRPARGRSKSRSRSRSSAQTVQVPTVLGDTRNADGSWNFFLEGRDRIGYVRITSFTDKTADELEQALAWLSEHDMRGLVLDLRDDPGGYLDAAVDVCDLLIDSGVIVTTRGRDGRISRHVRRQRQGAASPISPWPCWSTSRAPAPPKSSPPVCKTTIGR